MAEVKWIKITTGLFSDEKIMLIEQMPEADTLLVVWFKLLCMAGRENNSGVFIMNGTRMPYTDEMLATIFRRPINTVRLALSTFEAFGMIEVDDGIISIPNWEKHQNIDGLDKIRENTRKRVQKHRENQKRIECNVTVTDGNATDKNRIDKNRIEEKKEVSKDTKKKPPRVYFEDEELNGAFADFVENRKELKKPMTDRAVTLAIKKLTELAIDQCGNIDKSVAIKIINQSIERGWTGFYPLDNQAKQKPKYYPSGAINWEDI